MFEQDMNVTAGSRVKDLGFAFINYWLSTPVQRKWAEKFFWTPANSHVTVSSSLRKYFPVTQQTLHLIPRWNYVWLNVSSARTQMTNYWNHRVTGHC
jgi:putative spermidine/putrescine transport system substrate-binding protein